MGKLMSEIGHTGQCRAVDGFLRWFLASLAVVFFVFTVCSACVTTVQYREHYGCPSASVVVYNQAHIDGVDLWALNRYIESVPLRRAKRVDVYFCGQEPDQVSQDTVSVVSDYRIKIGDGPWQPMLPGDFARVVIDHNTLPVVRIKD